MSDELPEDAPSYSRRRIEICRQCPEYHFYTCRKCHCFMPLKVKFAAVRCPLGKWGPEQPEPNSGV